MGKSRFLALLLLLVLPLAGAVVAPNAAADPASAQVAPAQAGPIIVDHTCTDLSQIPPYWIEQAKALLRLFYGHTSHGSQLPTGMQVLMDDPSYGGLYDFNYNGAVTPGVLSLDDHNGDMGDLGNPDFTTWATQTRNYLNTPGNDRNVVLWSWCGQVTGATEEDINTYLSLMTQLEQDYPNLTFIYMTGHLDGSGVDGTLNVRNNQIRGYVQANNKILFDFADIESYDPDGNYFLDRGADDGCYYDGGNGNWATEWCAAHTDDPLCAPCDCAHSEALNCNLKARATWWLLARLTGWSGPAAQPDFSTSSKVARPWNPAAGDTVGCTIHVVNSGSLVTATVLVSDTVPAGLAYISGSLAASSGAVDDSGAPLLRWSGMLDPDPAVTITYAVTVTTSEPQRITNTAYILVPEYANITRTATVWANWESYTVFLPLIPRH